MSGDPIAGRSPGIPGAQALTHILVVADVGAAREWYESVLGAGVHREYESSAVLELLGTWLLLVAPGGPTSDKPGVSFLEPSDPDVVGHAVTIRVADCSLAYRELCARGAVFLTPPVDRGSEVRCFLRDPDGHLFELSEAR
jgi:catechol 2,3-dioxygenase-like lactoylglutathione lyase family enzyme